ncbi:type VI secretion system protein TssA [Scandinavium manionii]|uniref:type VI secretion system protein TssA n=1 Tax=Scandinavium manionii TaxID=2926520 RepID=UPI001359E370|nr:type VI secretion system protein TssA [Scandinavium manionii]MCS2164493.1 type VI secretion system protein TssA [Scandinavium manionii]
MNLNDFLMPVTPEHPCGENLEYDADFQAMEQATQGKGEQQFGDTIIPAEPADWTQVEKLALGLLQRTKDLRVMLALTHAWTKRRGLMGYADGLLLVQQALSLYWQQLYPQLEEFGETDPIYRINALAGLSDKSELTTALRNAALLRSNSDELTLRDAQMLLDGSKTECGDYPGGRPRLIDELSQGDQPGIQAILVIHERLQTVREMLVDYLGESSAPEMEQLQKTVRLVANACQVTDISTFQRLNEESDVNEHNTITAGPKMLSADDWRSAQIITRADAQLMLEKTKQYFVQYEPSHPAPLLIERVQRLIKLDFMDIIRDLAPESLSQLENIIGRRE